MPNAQNNKSGVALMVVLVMLLIVILLANVVLHIMLSQTRLTQHQVNRIRAYYAAMAGINLTYEQLRKGLWVRDAAVVKYYCINGNVDAGVTCSGDELILDPNIPYNVQIEIIPESAATLYGTVKFKSKVDYTYVPINPTGN